MEGLVCILFFGFLASGGCIFLICHRLKKIEDCLSSDVKALEARDEDLKREVADLRRRVVGLHKVLYEALDSLRGFRSK